jgi:monoamine oxidase
MADGGMWDVAVIGGGAAGLAAAGALAAGGADVVLLEARGRLGGRVHTLHDAAWPLPVELGAEFIDVPGPAFDALRTMGGTAYRSSGGQWDVALGKARPLDYAGTIGQVLGRLDPPPERDQPFRQWLEACCADADDNARFLALKYVEGFHAADLDRVGVHWLAQAARQVAGGGGNVRWHPLGGFDLAVRGLAAACPGARVLQPPLTGHCEVRLGTVVRAVNWGRHGSELHCISRFGSELEPVRAHRVLVTVPLGVLQAPEGSQGAIRFTPALDEKRGILGKLAMGNVLKLVFRFREPFWEDVLEWCGDDGTREHKFLMDVGEFPAWWTPSPVAAPVLTAWAGGGAATRVLAQQGDHVAHALGELASVLDVPIDRVQAEVVDWRRHDWHADPFSRGAYSYVPADALPAQRSLAEPVDDVVFFAGEATAEGGWVGTVDGAILSGRRAATEILRSLS